MAVSGSVDKIGAHFSTARNLVQKVTFQDHAVIFGLWFAQGLYRQDVTACLWPHVPVISSPGGRRECALSVTCCGWGGGRYLENANYQLAKRVVGGCLFLQGCQ